VRPPFNFDVAVIIIFKHATTLRPAGLSVQLALFQALSNYQELNISSIIAQHFTAPPSNYSIQDFVHFIMGISVSLLLLYYGKT